MEHFNKSESTSNKSNRTQRTIGQDSLNTEGYSTAAYTEETQILSTNSSQLTSDQGTGMSTQISWQGSQGLPNNENIKLVPIKLKDAMNIFKASPAFSDKAPGMINVNENYVNDILEQYKDNSLEVYNSPNTSLKQSTRGSPMSVRRSVQEDTESIKLLGYTQSPKSLNQSHMENSVIRSSLPISEKEPGLSKPPLVMGQTPQVYAMTDIQAYPMIGESGFRAHKTRRKKSPRVRSRKKITPARRIRRSRSRNRSKSRKRPRSRGRSRRRKPKRRWAVSKSRPRRVVRVRSRKRSPVILPVRPKAYMEYCTPYPLCDTQCTPTYCSPYGSPVNSRRMPLHSTSRPLIQTPVPTMCDCYLCMNKLQFIQPGVCSKKKYRWTNEYAVLPKPQVNMIDPCEELDRTIYPRADNPCIRDGKGNPLTDCIGRPLRDPVGKRFLHFTGNGSVMDTNFRGNFYSGQPPLCVKCPMPGTSCAPDTTHNWWMSCGHPINPNMYPYQQDVLARENRLYGL